MPPSEAGDTPAGLAVGAPELKAREPKWSLIALALICCFSFLYMEVIAISEWMAGVWHLADVGNINYCLVNTWLGDFMYSPLASCNHFALHFTPFFFFLLPLVWLSDYPVPLVTAYQLALALTPVPLYFIARQLRLSPAVGLGLGVWFLGNHFVGSLQLSNHFEAFFVLFALGAVALMRSSRSVAFWMCAVLALSVKEDCAIWMLAYAAWEWVFARDEPMVRRRAMRLGMLALVWGLVAGGVMMLASVGEDTNAGRYVSRMGGIRFGVDTAVMIALIFITTGGLALLNWRSALLLALMPLPVILGNFHVTRNLEYYYSYPFLPFMALATAAGTARLVEFVRAKGAGVDPQKFQTGVAVFLVALGLAQFTLKTRTNDHYRVPHRSTPRDDLRRVLATDILPRDVPLGLQYGLWGVVPWRKDVVFLSDEELKDHHYVFMDMRSPHGYGPKEFQVLADRLTEELESGRRKEVYGEHGFVILSPALESTTTGSVELP